MQAKKPDLRERCATRSRSPCASSLHVVKKAVTGGDSMFHSSSSHLRVTWWLNWLLLGLHCSPVMRVTSAPRTGFPLLRVVPAALWFSWLLMWRLRSTKGQSQFAAGRVWGRSCFGLISITGLKFGEMLCRSAMIKGIQKESQFPKSHNFSYDVKLMRISSTTWERRPRRAWAEFVSTYGTSYVWLKTSNETRILTLYPLLEATRSRKVSWLQIIGHKRRNKFI